MSQNEEILDCKIEQNQSLLLDNDKFVSKFVPFSIIQDLPDNKNLPLSSTDGQVHHDDTKTFAKDFKNIVSKWVTDESVIHALVTLPADKSDEPDALKDNIKKALKCFSRTDNPQFVALLKKQEEKGLSLRIFAEVFANDTDEQKSKWYQCCKEIWGKTPAKELALHATLKALKESIGKALKAFLGKTLSIFRALKCGGKNLIQSFAPPNDEKWKPENELKKWPGILKAQKLLIDIHGVFTRVAALFSFFWSSIKNFLFSTWTVYKNWVFIASVLLNLVTLLGWFGYFVFVRDNTIQISLPDTIPNSVPVWAYDNEGQPCEEGKKLSRDDRRYIIKCGILPAQWSAKTIRISGYQIIELSSLKQDNGHYEVTENDLKPLTEWPVVFSDNPALPFEISTEVQFFDSEPDCKNNPKYLDWRTYQSSVEPLAVNKQPRWAKIRRGDEDLSYCAEGKENFETQDFRITFSFKSNQFEGKRKIVVIAPSVQLASDGIGRIIQDTLKEWLLELKTNQTNVPITILLIGANEEINTLIRSEDLNELPDERENSITAKVNGIAFANESFRSVYELEQVDVALEGKDFDQVLYLTDGKSYSGYSTLSSSLKKALGIPQYWMNNGVSFSVLTVSNCEFWDTEMSDAKCQTLDSQDKKIAQRRFKEMLGKLLPKY
jgi:hypothetical protein